VVWNIKSQQERIVTLVPSDTWGGAGLLGVTIRLDNYAGAEDRLIRVLEVEPHSPAALAGLQAEVDFLLGTTHESLDSPDRLGQLLHEHLHQVLELYVYNTLTDRVRTVAVWPTCSWGPHQDSDGESGGGGGGLLGAHVAVGYLHRLPHSVRNTSGSSVVRKVRYVTVPTAPTTPNSTASSVQANENNDNNNQQEGSSWMEPQAYVVMEPQLEMELSSQDGSDDDDDDHVEEVFPLSATQKSALHDSSSSLPRVDRAPMVASRHISGEPVIATRSWEPAVHRDRAPTAAERHRSGDQDLLFTGVSRGDSEQSSQSFQPYASTPVTGVEEEEDAPSVGTHGSDEVSLELLDPSVSRSAPSLELSQQPGVSSIAVTTSMPDSETLETVDTKDHETPSAAANDEYARTKQPDEECAPTMSVIPLTDTSTSTKENLKEGTSTDDANHITQPTTEPTLPATNEDTPISVTQPTPSVVVSSPEPTGSTNVVSSSAETMAPTSLPAPPSIDAEEVFARPPPSTHDGNGETTAASVWSTNYSAVASFLPPPPKMTAYRS
jgi:hypothetical protein